jgi:hypothetical protein
MKKLNTLVLVLTLLHSVALVNLAAADRTKGKQKSNRSSPTADENVPALAAPINSPLTRLGLLDVTAEPFLADPTGQKDATAALRQAIAYAHQRNLVICFPAGIYTVSDTLEYAFNRAKAKQGGEDSACQMLGARGGPKRARIVLAPQSAGFDKAAAPKPSVHIWAQSRDNPALPQPNISMNNLFLNIDIEIRAGNPGAIGIHHGAVQGSGIEDATIYAGDGYAGIMGLQAGGGGTHHVTVIGGCYGLELNLKNSL